MKNRTNIFLIIFLVVFLISAYFWYSKSQKESESGGIITDARQEEAKKSDDTFVLAIGKLKTIDLDVGFFVSEKFQSLEDLTPDIVYPAEVGRRNPFLPF
ncbi:hypothetical protein KKA27_02485 [Patescibacteria group bacterium]|nr:hypothetical protein [Patescibacteria group bacterium]MBU2633193.1 hypothetical protein [Patescibacteria group bacterium]